MVMPFLMTCAATLILAAVIARWWVLWLPLSFGIFVVVVGSDNQYGVAGTAGRVGFWMLVLTIAAAAVIKLRRRLRTIIRSRA
jgi:hypothetical protein